MSAFATFIQYCTRDPSHDIWARKWNKMHPVNKKEVKLFLLAHTQL